MTVPAPRSHRYLIFGQPRGLLADALVEYREFARDHPGHPLAETLTDVARNVHAALHETRAIQRATGEPGKVNARCGNVSARDRYRRRVLRRERLDELGVQAAEPDRFCSACGADILGNDPHEPDCHRDYEGGI